MALRAVIDHPKFANLKTRINRSKYQTLGILETLWHFTGRYTPQGNIGKYSNSEIESWIEWDGEPDTLIQALIETRWIDINETHRLIVHDWKEHADNTTKIHLKRQKLPFIDKCCDSVETVLRPPEPVPEPVPEPETLLEKEIGDGANDSRTAVYQILKEAFFSHKQACEVAYNPQPSPLDKSKTELLPFAYVKSQLDEAKNHKDLKVLPILINAFRSGRTLLEALGKTKPEEEPPPLTQSQVEQGMKYVGRPGKWELVTLPKLPVNA